MTPQILTFADRRRVQERIDKIRGELEIVRRQRSTQRLARQRNKWPLASIVGYTNAGKSTLLNALTGAAVLVEDKLFATLDPTTRRLRLPTNQNVLLTDTVGFIRKLPHGLVESFKATLEEVVQADLLVHVVDASHPEADRHVESVNAVLAEIGAEGKSTLMVFNKAGEAGSVPASVLSFRCARCCSLLRNGTECQTSCSDQPTILTGQNIIDAYTACRAEIPAASPTQQEQAKIAGASATVAAVADCTMRQLVPLRPVRGSNQGLLGHAQLRVLQPVQPQSTDWGGTQL